MFNVGGGELLVIILVALIVLGPQRLPGAIRQAGQWLGELRRISSGFQTDLSSALAEAERDADRARAEKAREDKGVGPAPSAAAPMLPVNPTPAPAPTPSDDAPTPENQEPPPTHVGDDASDGGRRPVVSPDRDRADTDGTSGTSPSDDDAASA